jgi:hypothetical protein
MNITEKNQDDQKKYGSNFDLQFYVSTIKQMEPSKRALRLRIEKVRDYIVNNVPPPETDKEKHAFDRLMKTTYIVSEMMTMRGPSYFSPAQPLEKSVFSSNAFNSPEEFRRFYFESPLLENYSLKERKEIALFDLIHELPLEEFKHTTTRQKIRYCLRVEDSSELEKHISGEYTLAPIK